MSDEYDSYEQPYAEYPIMDERKSRAILHQDRLLARPDAPFCGDTACKCHCDREAILSELLLPMKEGLLTQEEMSRLYTGRQIC